MVDLTDVTLRIDGATQLVGIIGDPVAQVKAPQPLSTLMQSRGLNAVLVPLQVSAQDVPALLQSLLMVPNFVGLIATVPHKQLAAQLASRVSKSVSEAQAANVLRKINGAWEAELLDGLGFAASLRGHGVEVRGSTVAMAGAGGAGNAIAFALGAAGAAEIAVHDVDAEREQALVQRLNAHGYRARVWDARTPADIVINATPLGMKPSDPLPMDPAALVRGGAVADVIMEPHETALLQLARSQGARVVHGRGMMEQQLQQMSDFFSAAMAVPARTP